MRAHRHGPPARTHTQDRELLGGSTVGAQALYELAQTDGLARSIDELRSDIARVHDPRIRDELPEQCTSYLLQDWNARLMQAMPYAQAEQFLAQLLGVRQAVQTLERDQARLSAQVEAFWEQLPAPAPLPPEAILVDSVDGKGVCMRPRETAGARGKNEDGHPRRRLWD
jgi:hypothetical protein